jgi:hypothetical protein
MPAGNQAASKSWLLSSSVAQYHVDSEENSFKFQARLFLLALFALQADWIVDEIYM